MYKIHTGNNNVLPEKYTLIIYKHQMIIKLPFLQNIKILSKE